MLTEEQIKNLKPGDIVDIRGFVNLPLCDGNILVELRYEFDNRILPAYKTISTEFISIPVEPEEKLKHDPTRLFKKGDVVTPRIYLGRKDKGLEMGEKYIVTADEIAGDMVAIKHHFTLRPDIVQTCFLELVTPVEELEPYKLIDSPNTYNIVRDSAMVMTIHKKSHPNALAAAEAERDRLNAEHRKSNS